MEVGGKPKCIGVELEKGKSELSETGNSFSKSFSIRPNLATVVSFSLNRKKGCDRLAITQFHNSATITTLDSS